MLTRGDDGRRPALYKHMIANLFRDDRTGTPGEAYSMLTPFSIDALPVFEAAGSENHQ